jgi:hypothetical protein
VAWSVLQSNSATDSTANQGSFGCTYTTANLSAGTKLIAAVEISGSASAVTSSVKDGALNSFTKIFSVNLNNTAGDGELSLWAIDTPAGDVGSKPTITATFSTATEQGCNVLIQEVSGLAVGNTTAAMIDGSAATLTGSTGASTGSPAYSSTASNEYLIAVYGDASNTSITWTAPSGGGYATDPHSVNTTGAGDLGVAYKSSTNGSEVGSWGRTNATSNWAAALVAFQLPPAGGAAASQAQAAAPGQTWRRQFHHRQMPDPGPQAGGGASSISGGGGLAAGFGGVTFVQPIVPGPVQPGRTWREQFWHRQIPPGLPPGPQLGSGASVLAGGAALVSAGAKSATGASAIAATGLVASPPPGIVQQVTGASTYDYGLSTVQISTSPGNTLIVLAGWDLSTQATSAAMPAVYVTDSAGNYWYHAGTSSSSVTGSRAAAWVCVNSRPVQWVSVSLSTFASSLAYTVLEVSGMPAYFSPDISAANAVAAGTSLAVSPGSAVSADVGFTFLTAGASGLAAPSTPSGWAPLTTVTSGAGSANPVTIYPFWNNSLAAGTTANITYTVAQQVPLAGVTFGIAASPPLPLQVNPNMPIVKAEAAFGYDPGDPSQPPPVWTDISQRVIGKDGEAFASSVMGREYELSQVEAGELHLSINNQDGAFTPGNAASPYAAQGGAALGTPVRLSAFWAGHWYYVGFGYVERWPLQWPDLPQWGISPMIATDAVSVMASATMAAALDSDMLLDAPYVFIQGSEQYTTLQNGINPTFVAADAQGLLAANTSRVNARAAAYVDGAPASGSTYQAATGQSTSMLGDSDSGFGTTAITAAAVVSQSGPGVIYTDANMPDPQATNGVSVEFWLIVPAAVASTGLQPVVFSAYGPPSNYLTAHPSLMVQINNFTGSHTLTVTLADGSAVTATFNVSANPQQVVLTLTSSALSIYVNGALAASSSLTAAQTTSWNAFTVGNPNYAYQAGGTVAGNYTAFDIATYPYILPVQRILSHYVTGATGQQGVDAVQRVAQVLSWANLGFARGGQEFFNGTEQPLDEGPAYSLSGASASDALNQVALNEGGMLAAMPSGALVFIHKWALFNQAPVAVFGDAPSPSAGEVPYLQPTTWDLDNTYLFNLTQTTQQVGANNTITAQAVDFSSQHDYFTRSALQVTIETTSNLDAFDSANYAVAKYAQPQLRVSGVQIDAASNPAAAFPVILALQQGQVVTVTRRPAGGAVITGQVIVQKIQHDIGPTSWVTSLQLSPYSPENAILQLDTAGYDVLGNMGLA